MFKRPYSLTSTYTQFIISTNPVAAYMIALTFLFTHWHLVSPGFSSPSPDLGVKGGRTGWVLYLSQHDRPLSLVGVFRTVLFNLRVDMIQWAVNAWFEVDFINCKTEGKQNLWKQKYRIMCRSWLCSRLSVWVNMIKTTFSCFSVCLVIRKENLKAT